MDYLLLGGILATIANILSGKLHDFALLILAYYNVKSYIVTDEAKIALILKRVTKVSTHVKEDEPYGLVFGKWYVCDIKSSSDNRKEIALFCSQKTYETLTKSEDIRAAKEKDDFSCLLVNNVSSYKGEFGWKAKKRNYAKYSYFLGSQISAAQDIIDFYKKNKFCVALLYGEPGTGKSGVGKSLAAMFNCYYLSQDISEPGFNLDYLYNKFEDKQLVLEVGEADTSIFKKILGISEPIETSQRHRNLVKDKSTFNLLLDRINDRHYPKLILIFTMNSELKDLEAVDPSLFREGRINVIHKIEKSTQRKQKVTLFK